MKNLSEVKYIIPMKIVKGPAVVHCRKEVYDIYIGRPSEWGNPFVIGKDGTREQVIEKYRQWIHSSDVKATALRRKARVALRGKVLGCWCVPEACHGDILLDIANPRRYA